MLGTFRMLLALAVAMTHIGITVFGLDIGSIAVFCFYLISGYVMTGVIRTHYPEMNRAPGFYLDRALRLLPHYFVIAAITLAWFHLAGTRTYFLERDPSWPDLFNNLTIVPFNYYMFNDSDRFALVPTAWSLGAEIQFYFIAPMLIVCGGRGWVLAASGGVYVLACLGYLNTEWYGYRLAAGVLFTFMIGSLLYESHRRTEPGRTATVLVTCTMAAAAGIAVILFLKGGLSRPFNAETLLGLFLGVPVLHLLGRLPRVRWDDRIGDLAYGIFLNHLTVQLFLFTRLPITWATILLYLAISIMVAILVFSLVERPMVALRQRLRSAGKFQDLPAR